MDEDKPPAKTLSLTSAHELTANPVTNKSNSANAVFLYAKHRFIFVLVLTIIKHNKDLFANDIQVRLDIGY